MCPSLLNISGPQKCLSLLLPLVHEVLHVVLLSHHAGWMESVGNTILCSLSPDTIYVKATLDTKEILVKSVIMCPDSQETEMRRDLEERLSNPVIP